MSKKSAQLREKGSGIKDQGRYFPYLAIWKMKKTKPNREALIQNRLSNGNLKDTFPDPCSLILDPSDKDCVSVSDTAWFFDSLKSPSGEPDGLLLVLERA